MKKFWITAFSLMAAVSLAACGAAASAAPSSSEAVSSETLSSEPAKEEPSSPAASASGRLEKMSAPRYVGVVDDFAVNDAGETVLIMKPSHGRDGNGTLNVALTEDTAYTMEHNSISNGAELEIFYVLNEQKEAVAVQINDADEIPSDRESLSSLEIEKESVGYDGVVLDIYFDPSNPRQGSIEMIDLEGKMPYVFHFYEETAVEGISLNEIKPDIELHIEHSQISTRSLPPQSNAFSISPYQSDVQ